jgi:hypothetical protein
MFLVSKEQKQLAKLVNPLGFPNIQHKNVLCIVRP